MVDLAKLILSLIAIVITVLLFALTFTARNNVSRSPNLAQNASLKSALRYINIALVFFGIGIFLIFVILVLVFLETPTTATIVRILTYITFPIITLAWIFSIIAAINLQRSGVSSGSARSAYYFMSGVSVVTILSWIGILAAIILLSAGRNKKVQEFAKEQFLKGATVVGLKTSEPTQKSEVVPGEQGIIRRNDTVTGPTFTSNVVPDDEIYDYDDNFYDDYDTESDINSNSYSLRPEEDYNPTRSLRV